MSTLQPEDPRPLKLLSRLPDDCAAIRDVVAKVQALAAQENVTLSANFDDPLALIVACNQFLRVHRGEELSGHVELLLAEGDRETLQQAVEVLPATGMVFQMFGWQRFDARKVTPEVLEEFVGLAYETQRAKGAPKGI